MQFPTPQEMRDYHQTKDVQMYLDDIASRLQDHPPDQDGKIWMTQCLVLKNARQAADIVRVIRRRGWKVTISDGGKTSSGYYIPTIHIEDAGRPVETISKKELS